VSRFHGAAAAIGAAWGAAGYAVLWGLTPIVVHRPFVVSFLGTVLLAPVRVVLFGIRIVEERIVDSPLDFSANHGWIGFLSAAVGAALVVGSFVVARWGRRTWPGRRLEARSGRPAGRRRPAPR
jgi:hypothetical protein